MLNIAHNEEVFSTVLDPACGLEFSECCSMLFGVSESLYYLP